jgi:hypothetical protein
MAVETCYAQCHYALCRLCWVSEISSYAEAECHHTECRYAEKKSNQTQQLKAGLPGKDGV